MSEKFNALIQLYTDALNEIASSASWRRFLKTAAYNYKFEFQEQVLIYAQNPNASVVMSEDAWEEQYGRTVNRSNSIGLIEPLENRVKLAYNIEDTTPNGEKTQSVPVFVFGSTSKHLEECVSALNTTYQTDEKILKTPSIPQ